MVLKLACAFYYSDLTLTSYLQLNLPQVLNYLLSSGLIQANSGFLKSRKWPAVLPSNFKKKKIFDCDSFLCVVV